jgi:hypothetical protein
MGSDSEFPYLLLVREDGMDGPNKSEIARLREQIALEYRAAQRVFTDFTPTARHEYMIKRQEKIAAHFNQLTHHMSYEDAMLLVIQVDNEVHGLSSSGNTS